VLTIDEFIDTYAVRQVIALGMCLATLASKILLQTAFVHGKLVFGKKTLLLLLKKLDTVLKNVGLTTKIEMACLDIIIGFFDGCERE